MGRWRRLMGMEEEEPTLIQEFISDILGRIFHIFSSYWGVPVLFKWITGWDADNYGGGLHYPSRETPARAGEPKRADEESDDKISSDLQ